MVPRDSFAGHGQTSNGHLRLATLWDSGEHFHLSVEGLVSNKAVGAGGSCNSSYVSFVTGVEVINNCHGD